MFGKYFLVTAIHTKKKILVQYLIDGSMEDARSLMFDICIRVFKERLKYISCTIAEITTSEIKWYFWGDEEKRRVFDRSLDSDIFLVHFYAHDKKHRQYRTYASCMDSLDKLLAPDDEENSDDDEEYSFDISSMYHVANRISFRGVFLAVSDEANNETRIDFIRATHCPCCGKAHFDEEHKTIKLR